MEHQQSLQLLDEKRRQTEISRKRIWMEDVVLIRVAQRARNSLCFALMITHLHLHQ